MKRILLLTDFSDTAWNALFGVLKMFEKQKTTFLILNTYEPGLTSVLGERNKERLGVIYDSLAANSKLKLEEISSYLKKHHHNDAHRFEIISAQNTLIKAINEVTRLHDIDFIAMGTKGATGAKEVFMGSNAVKVINKIRNIPILAFPHEHDFKELRTIVFPTDYSKTFDEPDVKPMLDLALLWNSEIKVVQVGLEFAKSGEHTAHKVRLENHLKGVSYELEEVAMEVNVSQTIADFVKKTKGDMIALIHYPHTFLERLTREAVIKKVGFHTAVPLLVLPDK